MASFHILIVLAIQSSMLVTWIHNICDDIDSFLNIILNFLSKNIYKTFCQFYLVFLLNVIPLWHKQLQLLKN